MGGGDTRARTVACVRAPAHLRRCRGGRIGQSIEFNPPRPERLGPLPCHFQIQDKDAYERNIKTLDWNVESSKVWPRSCRRTTGGGGQRCIGGGRLRGKARPDSMIQTRRLGREPDSAACLPRTLASTSRASTSSARSSPPWALVTFLHQDLASIIAIWPLQQIWPL